MHAGVRDPFHHQPTHGRFQLRVHVLLLQPRPMSPERTHAHSCYLSFQLKLWSGPFSGAGHGVAELSNQAFIMFPSYVSVDVRSLSFCFHLFWLKFF